MARLNCLIDNTMLARDSQLTGTPGKRRNPRQKSALTNSLLTTSFSFTTAPPFVSEHDRPCTNRLPPVFPVERGHGIFVDFTQVAGEGALRQAQGRLCAPGSSG